MVCFESCQTCINADKWSSNGFSLTSCHLIPITIANTEIEILIMQVTIKLESYYSDS